MTAILSIEEAISRATAIASTKDRHASDNAELAVFLEEVLKRRKKRAELRLQCAWLLNQGRERKCRALKQELIDEATYALR